MVRTNMQVTRIKPDSASVMTLRVLRRERLSPSFARVVVGGGDIDRFAYMGFDHWFRLFLPVSDASLSRLPKKLDMLAYLRFLTISKTDRPVMRNYTVAGARADGPEGPELDIDFVLHGSAADGTAGPAAAWAETCVPGDAVGIYDEGISYNPAPACAGRILLVADETALPAAAGILTSVPRDVTGTAVIEVPHADDRREIAAPEGVDVRWVVRADDQAIPGVAARAAATELAVTREPMSAWIAGEQSLATGLRRHLVDAGVSKDAITFTGYWRSGAAH